MSWAPWRVLSHWSPFKIDALGLVTLLGAEEVNAAVGRLVRSAYLEYLPLLGAFVIAGDRFTEKAAGFNLYNISQGIHTTDLSAWLTRWMLSQDFEVTRSYVVWKITPPKHRKQDMTISLIISFILNGFLIALTVLSNDWYGFANAVAMVVSIMVRSYVVGQQRAAVDARVDEVVRNAKPPPREGSYEAARLKWLCQMDAVQSDKKETKERAQKRRLNCDGVKSADGNASMQSNSSTEHAVAPKEQSQRTRGTISTQTVKHTGHPDPRKFEKDDAWTGKDTKVLIIQSDSKAVTFWMPSELLAPPSLFIEGPKLLHPKRYFIIRSFGWLVFAVHIVAIGTADLASQLYTVVLLVLPTILLVLKFSCDDSKWRETITDWRKSSHHGSRTKQPNVSAADEGASATELVKQRECWIGSRLKAEIYEWPASYEFELKSKVQGELPTWLSGPPTKGRERSKKRQDLYAWLALTQDEEESMDKWDLFPHIRDDNKAWWETYKLKKRGLVRNHNFGPQLSPSTLAPPTLAAQTSAAGGQDTKDLPKHYHKPGRTRTVNFVSDPGAEARPGQAHQGSSVVTNSSAFPAISDHPHTVIISENDCVTDSRLHTPSEDKPNPLAESSLPLDPASDGHQSGSPVHSD